MAGGIKSIQRLRFNRLLRHPNIPAAAVTLNIMNTTRGVKEIWRKVGKRANNPATIKFATDPNKVRLPARVEAAARVSQPAAGLGRAVTAGLSKSMAGTFETRFERTTVIAESAAAP